MKRACEIIWRKTLKFVVDNTVCGVFILLLKKLKAIESSEVSKKQLISAIL